jgi:hypothetical protein
MDPDNRCTAHSTRTGNRCGRAPMKGQSVCATHGGRSPNGKAAGERRLSTERARAVVITYGLPVEIDPHDALMEEIARTAGHVRWLAGIIQSMDDEALVWGQTETQQRGGGGPTGNYAQVTRTAAPSVWLTLYQAERKHLVDVCKAAIGAGIAERQVRLAEQQGALIATVIRAIIGDPELGLDDDQQEVAFKVASRQLRILPAA